MTNRLSAAVLAAAIVFSIFPKAADAWSRTGHLLVSRVGAESLPDSVPAFLRTPQAIDQIERLGPEADNRLTAGTRGYHDGDPGHYVNATEDAKIAGIIPLSALPPDRESYDTALRAAGSDQYKSGYLPYELLDGFEIVRKDFAWWRLDDFGARTAATPADRTFYARARAFREKLTLHDIGFFSHFVGDASQPLHTSSYYDGWDRYPGSKGVHAKFESAYVDNFLTHDIVKARVKPFAACGCAIEKEVADYLIASNAQVTPLYELWKSGAFSSRTDAGVSYTADRLAAGASAFRNLIVEAWIGSEDQSVGYPARPARDILNGTVPLERSRIGD